MIPTEIQHYPVVAYAPVGPSEDGLGVVIANRQDRSIDPAKPFVTWRVWYDEHFSTWVAEHGHYDLTWHEARQDFLRRI